MLWDASMDIYLDDCKTYIGIAHINTAAILTKTHKVKTNLSTFANTPLSHEEGVCLC